MSVPKVITIPDPENLEMVYLLRLIRETERSIFLTGKAGTGKSTLLKHVSQTIKKKHVVLAPTGISALNAGGQTLHSFFKLPFGPLPPGDKIVKETLKKIRKEQRTLIRNLELIIIDEVSMVRSDIVDAIDLILRTIRGRMFLPFGGVQMLFVGDLFQLEPVVTAQDAEILRNFYHTYFFYGANAFIANKPIIVELTKVYRQKDRAFVDILDQIRTGKASDQEVKALNEHTSALDKKDALILPEDDFNITLTTRRDRAKKINEEHLERLSGDEYSFRGVIQDEFPEGSLPTEEVLVLKEGAQVMFVANDPQHQWVNGSLGQFLEFDAETGAIAVQLENGAICLVQQFTWENKRYILNPETNSIEEEIIGKFTQIPLKLAWAITIHKSQGLTFEHVTIDFCNGTFAAGQAYVALSRCRSLEGMTLTRPFRKYDIITRPEIVDYYQQAANEEVFQETLEESRAVSLYLQSISALNEGALREAITMLSEALQTKNMLDTPRFRRLFISKLYQIERIIGMIKQQSSEDKKLESTLNTFAEEYIEMGDQCLEEIGGTQAALRSYEKALSLLPKHPKALARKGKMLRLLGSYEEALRLLSEAYKDFFRHLDVSMELGLTYIDINKQEKAYDILSRLQTEHPHNLPLLAQLIELAGVLGYEKEKKRYKTLLTKEQRKQQS
ncbi:AAA family ATPase [Porphyromonas gingivicanis]|uniref:AAA family ATPase n=1 Tax=Porphyromonas gingivicanis TaxID=266762 RepID=UPI00068E0597|nr:AAA family ATPase [Porphyromonas gingivicanis]